MGRGLCMEQVKTRDNVERNGLIWAALLAAVLGPLSVGLQGAVAAVQNALEEIWEVPFAESQGRRYTIHQRSGPSLPRGMLSHHFPCQFDMKLLRSTSTVW